MFRNAETLFRPKTVAIIGASDTGGAGWPSAIYQNLEQAGFPARVFLINPHREELWGRKVYPNFASVPEQIDLALSIVPAEAAPDVLAEGVANGLRTALVFAARFGEGTTSFQSVNLPDHHIGLEDGRLKILRCEAEEQKRTASFTLTPAKS